ncbi:MAG: hypothetical protein NXH70_02540 [Hyphomonas sp.]|nr:hypothetical protein [Hyphomonas sp.]
MTEVKTYSQEEYEAGSKQAFDTGRQQGQLDVQNLASAIKMQRDEANDKIADLNVLIMELNQENAKLHAQVNAKPQTVAQ